MFEGLGPSSSPSALVACAPLASARGLRAPVSPRARLGAAPKFSFQSLELARGDVGYEGVTEVAASPHDHVEAARFGGDAIGVLGKWKPVRREHEERDEVEVALVDERRRFSIDVICN